MKHFLIELAKTYTPKSILDIGANKGEFGIFCSNLWNTSYIYMIEGNKYCEQYLRSTGIPYSISLLSDQVKQVEFYINKDDLVCTGCSYMRQLTQYDGCLVENIQTQKLDDIYDNNQSFDLIKLDTQGSELEIIKGGINTILNAGCVIIECSINKQYNENSPLIEEIHKFMRDIGFSNCIIVDEHMWWNNDNTKYNYGEVIQVDVAFFNDKFMDKFNSVFLTK